MGRPGSSFRLPDRPLPLSRVPSAEAGLVGADDGLGPVGDLQLGEDGRDVVRHRLGRRTEPLGAAKKALDNLRLQR